jgi:hypothetical protein
VQVGNKVIDNLALISTAGPEIAPNTNPESTLVFRFTGGDGLYAMRTDFLYNDPIWKPGDPMPPTTEGTNENRKVAL